MKPMKKPWLRWTALALAIAGSGFVACNNKGGLAGQCGGMGGCGGATASEESACNTAGGIWNGAETGANRCKDSKGKVVTFTSPC
jgi:hypothetical protein